MRTSTEIAMILYLLEIS